MRTWFGIGGERVLVPNFRLVVVAHLAVGVADVIGDVRVLVMAERVHRGDAGLVVAVEDHGAGGAVVAQEFLLRQLLLLLLDDVVVLLLFLLFIAVGRRAAGCRCPWRKPSPA